MEIPYDIKKEIINAKIRRTEKKIIEKYGYYRYPYKKQEIIQELMVIGIPEIRYNEYLMEEYMKDL